MQIDINQQKIQLNFGGKRPNDSTYRLLKNPETASDAMERGFVNDFLTRHPDWEKDEELVHRLKQDTIKARAKGKIHSQWHEFDQPNWLVALVGLLSLTGLTAFFIKHRNNFINLSRTKKIIYPACIPFFAWLTIDSLKYIFTGRTLFEKKQDNFSSQSGK